MPNQEYYLCLLECGVTQRKGNIEIPTEKGFLVQNMMINRAGKGWLLKKVPFGRKLRA